MRFEPRRIGAVSKTEGRHARVVGRFVDHGAPIDFRELSARIVPPETRYLVLDLDRTTHFGLNLGELLGWELCAHLAYGRDRLRALEPKRRGRFCLDWSHPRALARYLLLGMRLWAYAGLYYLAFGKVAARLDALRRRAYRRFGTEPIREVQRVPQTALFHQLSALPLETIATLAANVWDRHQKELVIEPEDIEWLRARCPDLSVIISSASPRPMVEIAAERLGVDDFISSAIDEHDGYLSAPFGGHRLITVEREPRRLSPPSRLQINASFAKIEHIIDRYPDFADPTVTKVGVTDNGYGEDQCWVEFFTVVADVNSRTPFSPIVTSESPIRELHSARLLTHEEKQTGHLDARRRRHEAFEERQLDGAALSEALGQILEDIELLATKYQARAASISATMSRCAERARAVRDSIEAQVAEYNESHGAKRRLALRRIRDHLAEEIDLRRQIARVERPLSELAYALTKRLEEARASV